MRSSSRSHSGARSWMVAVPAAKSLAVSTTRCWRAARASGVIGPPCPRSISRCAGVAVARLGTGGSWDRPPDAMSSTFMSKVATCFPMASPRSLTRWIGVNGGATELMKIGMNGFAVMSP